MPNSALRPPSSSQFFESYTSDIPATNTHVKTLTDKRGIVTEHLYDSLNRRVETRRLNEQGTLVRLVTNEYDDANNLSATIDANGNRTEYAYNSRNLLETTTFKNPGGSDGNRQRYYDGAGNLKQEFDEEGKETAYEYDGENRQKSVTFAGETTLKFYDVVGNLKRVLKPKENDRVLDYDGLNRLTWVREGGLLTTRFEYDANGNLLKQTDPLGHLAEFTYDQLNRKKQHIQKKNNGDLTVSHDEYDAEGNLRQMTDAKGQVFTYAYDELNRPTTTVYPAVTTPFLAPKQVVTDYDGNNNVATVTETKQASGGGTITDVTSNVWDSFDRLESSTQRGMTIGYDYDNNGNRTRVATANGSTAYTFDHRNRIKTAVAGTDSTAYTYTPAGRQETIRFPNGTSTAYTYWPSNRIETITHQAGETVISSYAYQYDKNGNRSRQVEVQGGGTETTDYLYDNLDRLKSFTLTGGGTTTATAYTFAGYNRKTEEVKVNGATTASKSYDYDETDWLTSVVDSAPATAVTVTYTYDNNGNTLSKTVGTGSQGVPVPVVTTFDYDDANRLVQTNQGATLLGRYDYNAAGMRVRHYGSERGDVEYFYDDGAVLEEYVAGAGGGLVAHYRYADRLLSLQTGSETQYYHHDALGSTVNLTGAAGAVKVRYTLDPWGHIRNQLGESVNRQIFTGQEHDQQTGLIYFGARYYDPDSARFITQDSYLGEPGTPPSLHRYLYAYSNPTVYVDLMGYASTEKDWEGIKTIPRAEPWSYDDNVPLNIAKAVGNGINNVGNSLLVDLPNDFLRIGQYYNNHGLSKTGKDAVDDTAMSVKNTYQGVKNYFSGVIDYAQTVPAKQQVEDTVYGMARAETLEHGVTLGLSVYLGGKAPIIADNAATLTGEALNGAKNVGQKINTAFRNNKLADEMGVVDDYVAGLYRKETPIHNAAGMFEVEQTGPYNYRVQGGETSIDIDGYAGRTMLEAKFVEKPNVSPYLDDSSVPEFLRAKILKEQAYEMQRYKAVINDKNVPFDGLNILTNDPKAAPYFQSLMDQYQVPGKVKTVDVRSRTIPSAKRATRCSSLGICSLTSSAVKSEGARHDDPVTC